MPSGKHTWGITIGPKLTKDLIADGGEASTGVLVRHQAVGANPSRPHLGGTQAESRSGADVAKHGRSVAGAPPRAPGRDLSQADGLPPSRWRRPSSRAGLEAARQVPAYSGVQNSTASAAAIAASGRRGGERPLDVRVGAKRRVDQIARRTGPRSLPSGATITAVFEAAVLVEAAPVLPVTRASRTEVSMPIFAQLRPTLA